MTQGTVRSGFVAVLRLVLRPVTRVYRRFSGYANLQRQLDDGLSAIAAELRMLRMQHTSLSSDVTGSMTRPMSPDEFGSLSQRLSSFMGSQQTPQWQYDVSAKIDSLHIELRHALHKIDYLQARLQEYPVDVLYSTSEKLDILLHARYSSEATNVHISREIDRLDGYLNFHLHEVKSQLSVVPVRRSA